jgi:spore coat polysaccharide biosynthesis predicted glycosyltransferase SpsG
LEPHTGDNVVFVPGAADVLNASLKIIALWSADLPELTVVLGPLVPEGRRRTVFNVASALRNVSILCAPANFAGIIAGAGMVICSASVTAYEALAMRKKTAVFSVAPNQSGLGRVLQDMGAAHDIGDWLDVSCEKILRALAFDPDDDILGVLVNKRGSLECAKELSRLSG